MDVGAAQAGATTPRHLPVPSSPRNLTTADAAKARKAAQDFESILVRDMIKTMRQSSPGGKGLLTGVGNNLYQDMMDDELAKALTRQGGLGFADVLVRSLDRGAPKKPSSPTPAQPIDSVSTTSTGEETPQ